MGVFEVFKEHYYADDPQFGLVDVKFLRPLNNQVTLQKIKHNQLLKNMTILKQPHLSISPVSEVEWNEIIKMSIC